MRAALELALASDLFLVVGSSLVVHPAAALPSLAKENGARLVIINREATPLDDQADLVIAGEMGRSCPKLPVIFEVIRVCSEKFGHQSAFLGFRRITTMLSCEPELAFCFEFGFVHG